MSSSRPTQSALDSTLTARVESPRSRGPQPVVHGSSSDGVADFLNSLLEQYEKTSALFQPKTNSPLPR